VLVIIGLIVGGVLVGRDLIKAAEVRAQVSQIGKFNLAANTFRGKYGYLPGDIPDPDASNFGFAKRGAFPHQGDGNGIIEGLINGADQQGGETVMFWVDLTSANGMNLNLIEGSFSRAKTSASYSSSGGSEVLKPGSPGVDDFLPKAKLGSTNYIYAWSGGLTGGDGTNYYTLSGVVYIDEGSPSANPDLTPNQAYAIDKKMDDGMPQSGTVTTMYRDVNNCGFCYAGGANGGLSDNNIGGPVTDPANASGETNSAYTCYDFPDPLHPSLPLTYSIATNGNLPNCALSFKFQ